MNRSESRRPRLSAPKFQCFGFVALASMGALAAVGVNACGKSDSSNNSTTGAQVGMKFTQSKLALRTALWDAEERLGLVEGRGARLDAPNGDLTGYNTQGEITDMLYFLTNVMIGERFKSQGGTGGIVDGKVVSAYTSTANSTPDSYDKFVPSVAEKTDAGFVNVLDPKALKALTSNTQVLPGSYGAVAVQWMRSFKIKGQVTLSDGTKVYTKKPTGYYTNGKAGLDVNYTALTAGALTGPAELQTMFFPNGGTNFKLTTPFVVSQADAEAQTKYVLNLVFDPEGLVVANKRLSVDCNNSGLFAGSCDQQDKIQMETGMLDITPVVYKEGETLLRETYLLSPQAGHPRPHAVRISLYYVKEDPKKTPRAVSIRKFIPSGADVNFQIFWSNADRIEMTADGKLNIKDWMGLNMAKAFERTTDVNAVKTVTHETCKQSTGYNQNCVADPDRIEYKYTLVGLEEIEKGSALIAVTPSPSPTPTP